MSLTEEEKAQGFRLRNIKVCRFCSSKNTSKVGDFPFCIDCGKVGILRPRKEVYK